MKVCRTEEEKGSLESVCKTSQLLNFNVIVD